MIAGRLAPVLIRIVNLARFLRLPVLALAGVFCAEAARAQVYQGRELVKAELAIDAVYVLKNRGWLPQNNKPGRPPKVKAGDVDG